MDKKIFDKYKRLVRELFLYGMIGLFSATMDTVSFSVLRRLGVPLFASNFLGVNIGIGISFFLNTYLNFRKTDELRRRAIRFFAVGYLGLLLSTVLMLVGVDYMKKPEMAVKLFSVLVVALVQYLLNKFILDYRKMNFEI